MILELHIRENVALPYNVKTCKVFEALDDGEVIQVEYKKESKGSLTMLGLWWMWMKETSDYMAGHGVTMPLMIDSNGKYVGERPFDKNDAHELFTAKWLGTDENGNRFSWSRDKNYPDRLIADTGQRHFALTRHEEYCIDRGIPITNPVKSEYRELSERMNS